MTVRELIEKLRREPFNAEVMIYAPQGERDPQALAKVEFWDGGQVILRTPR